jgi:hypothetical protein
VVAVHMRRSKLAQQPFGITSEPDHPARSSGFQDGL